MVYLPESDTPKTLMGGGWAGAPRKECLFFSRGWGTGGGWSSQSILCHRQTPNTLFFTFTADIVAES